MILSYILRKEKKYYFRYNDCMKFFMSIIFLLLFTLNADFVNSSLINKVEAKYGKFAKNRFLALNNLLEKSKSADIRTKLERVNDFFNGVKYASDKSVYGTSDYWANPYEFLAKDKGDCEDYVIAKYFALNTKNNPFVVTTSLLYNFFSKLLQYHGMIYKNAGANATDIAKQLGINPYGLKDYQAASKIYPMKKVSQNIAFIREIDLKGKGVNGTLTHDDLLKELLIKVLR